MFPHRLTDKSAFDIAQALVDGFNRHYRLFRETTAQAKQRFEQADWAGQQSAQALRIEFYDRRVKLIMSAATPPEGLYTVGPMVHEFPRTVSRLNEMQSAAFLDQERRVVDTSLT